MPALTIGNVLSYSAQLGIVAVVGLVLARFGGLHRCAVHYTYLRALLLVCVLLPFAQPLAPAALFPRFAISARAVPGNSVRAGGLPATQPQSSRDGFDPRNAAGAVLVGGAAARLAWLALGLVTLRRLRRRSMPTAPLAPGVVSAVGLVGAVAEVRVSPDVTRPVTFGLARPLVLLPPGFDDFDEDEQAGVLAHELLHVKRHDWIQVLGEELVRAALWFHPAIWWLLGRLSIAREQLVDREVVGLLGGRRAYLEALLKVARVEHVGARLPTAAMVRESQLGQRVRLLLEEVVMSRKRMSVSLAVACALLVATSVVVVQAFPLAVQSTTSAAGSVQAPRPGMVEPPVEKNQAKPDARQVIRRSQPVAVPVSSSPLVIVEAEVGTDGHVTRAAGVAGDPALFDAATDAVLRWVFETGDEPLRTLIGLNLSATTSDAARPEPLRVGGVIQPPTKVKHVRPEYPPDAKEAGVQGIVSLESAIGPEGKVRDARVLRSVAGLDQAALLSVLQWEFEPVLMNGAPTAVIMTVTINFTLQ